MSGSEALLRAAANEEARMLALMPAGTALELTGKKGDWYRVKYPQEDGSVSVGYVHQAMISFFPEATAEQAQPPEDEIKDPETKETAVEISPPVTEPEQADIPKEEEPPATPEFQEQPVVETHTTGLGLGIRGGYALPSESGYEGSLAVGFSLAYRITPNLEIEAGGLFYESQVEGQVEGLSRGKLRVLPLFLSVKGRYPLGHRFAPYAVAGVGYFFNR